eukprot:242627_1
MTKNELLKALKKYKAEYIVDVILEYLPFTFEITEDIKHTTSFLYTPIARVYDQRTTRLCPIWTQNIRAKTTFDTHKYSDNNASIPEIKCVMYGDGGVGKSALTIRFICDNFLDEYDPTIEDSYRKSISVSDQVFMLDILDTAGREEFTSMQDLWIRESKIFLLLFAINRRHNFENIYHYRERLLRSKNEDDDDWGMILVGTKCDLEDQRQVTTAEAVEKAKQWNIPYIETSAKNKINVDFVYEQVIYTYWTSSVQSVNRE